MALPERVDAAIRMLRLLDQRPTVRQLGLGDSGVSRGRHAARMSVSAFPRIIQAVTAVSPLPSQKMIRRQEARMLLLTNPRDVARLRAAAA